MDSSHSVGTSVLQPASPEPIKLKFLTRDQVARIDELLASVGDYGEIHLIVQRGQLRYINRVESYKAWSDGGKK